MPIEFLTGDLFVNRRGAQAFAHGCNCKGSMGAGIARTFRDRYPEMAEEFKQRCKAKPPTFNLGDCWLYCATGQPHVFNLATQQDYFRSRASYPAIEQCLIRMRQQADEASITLIAMPRIGAGYGGLSWRKVRELIERVFGDWRGILLVYEEFAPETRVTNEASDHPTDVAS